MRRTDLPRRPALRLWLLALCLLAVTSLPASVQAAALIEAKINGTPVRLVADRASDRVLLVAGATRALFDLAGGSVYLSEGGVPRRIHARYRPGYGELSYRIERFGPGPVIGSYVTTYHVLFVDEQVCAELSRFCFDFLRRNFSLKDVHCFSFSFCRRLNSCSCRATMPW